MIIKSKGMPIKAIGDVLSYIMRDEVQYIDALGHAPFIKQHLRGKTIEEWSKEFISNESTRRAKNKKARGFYHCIISFHPDDSRYISASLLERTAKRFIELRSPNSLVIGTAHSDNHIHLHLVISSIMHGGSGDSIRIGTSEFSEILRSMASFQEIEFPELEFSRVTFDGKSLEKDNEYQMRLRGKVPEKQLVIAHVKASYESSRSFPEFIESLKMEGYEPYERNGKIVGIKGSRRYRFITMGISLDRFNDSRKHMER